MEAGVDSAPEAVWQGKKKQ